MKDVASVGRALWQCFSRLRGRVHIAELILLLVLLAGLVPFVRYGGRVIAYAYPVDYGEGPLLDQARRLSELTSILALHVFFVRM